MSSQEHVIHRESELEHYCNSTETENNIKPSLAKRCFEGKDAIIKTSPRQREAEKPLSLRQDCQILVFPSLSVSLYLLVFVSLRVCVLGRYKEIARERKTEIK